MKKIFPLIQKIKQEFSNITPKLSLKEIYVFVRKTYEQKSSFELKNPQFNWREGFKNWSKRANESERKLLIYKIMVNGLPTSDRFKTNKKCCICVVSTSLVNTHYVRVI